MKTYCFIICFLILLRVPHVFGQSNTVSSSQALTVKDISKELKSKSWYASQAEIWQSEIKSNLKDAAAWFNYYKAERYSYFTQTSKKLTETEQASLDYIIETMGKYVSSSFEYNYLKYLNGNNNTTLFPYLEKAYKAEPDNAEAYDDFVAYYELTGNETKKEEFCSKLSASNTFETEINNYNKNVLLSLEKNAIIFTNGTNDTYPLWIQQTETRSDVTVLNIDLLKNKNYLTTKFASLGLTGDSASLLINNPKYFYEYISRKNPAKPIYFALTIPKSDLELITEKLYPTGLAYKYSTTDIDNLSLLEASWKTFNTDYLFTNESHYTALGYSSTVNKLNMNYVMPMVLLYRKYLKDGENTKAEDIKKQAIILAKRIGKESTVEGFFLKND